MLDNAVTFTRVTDTGIGIPADELTRVFERFHRAGNVREETIRGSGLGLTIARSIAHAHRGTIEAFATGDPGTTFIVRLPLARRNRSAG